MTENKSNKNVSRNGIRGTDATPKNKLGVVNHDDHIKPACHTSVATTESSQEKSQVLSVAESNNSDCSNNSVSSSSNPAKPCSNEEGCGNAENDDPPSLVADDDIVDQSELEKFSKWYSNPELTFVQQILNSKH